MAELTDLSAELPSDFNRDKYLRSVAQYLLNTNAIEELTDMRRLRLLHKQAVLVKDMDEFSQALQRQ